MAAPMRPAALHPAPSCTPLARRHSRIKLVPSRRARQAAHGVANSTTFRRPADLPLCECKPGGRPERRAPMYQLSVVTT